LYSECTLFEILDPVGGVCRHGERHNAAESKSHCIQGFAESYLLSEVSASSLTNFFTIFILNRKNMSGSTSTITASVASSIGGLLRATNTLANARLHIAAHYDISNAMFAAFLSPDMTYSCAIWRKKNDPLGEAEMLQDAQERKLARVMRAARLKSTDRVLEIGTGWGSFAIKAASETGCSIVSLTLSAEQKKLAEKRIRQAGLEEKIEVRLCDYRELKVPPEGEFDKIVSIEMLEAVGREYLDTYFACVDKLLKKDGGIGVFQCITIPESVSQSFLRPLADLCSDMNRTPKVMILFADTSFQEVICLLLPSWSNQSILDRVVH
jgi:cyclopropane-fatty-acyl-phospholipid synthase